MRGGWRRQLEQRPELVVWLALILVSWLGHFLLAGSFGLYEDDYFYIADPISGGWPAVGESFQYLLSWPQGRPVGFVLPFIFARLGYSVAGFPGMYAIGLLIVAANTLLFYDLLRQFAPIRLAALGALMFCLFPGDTTKTLLTHLFQLQTSLLFVLIGLRCMVAGRQFWGFFSATLALLCYESAFFLFLAAPLLRPQWDRRLLRDLLVHNLIAGAIVAVVVLIRMGHSEARIVEMQSDNLQTLSQLVLSIVFGPFVSLFLLAYGPWLALRSQSLDILLISLVAALAAYASLVWLKRRSPVDQPVASAEGWAINRMPLLRLGIIACIFLGLAYVVAFTHYPPTARTGRETSVHLAATVGCALLFAVCAEGLLRSQKRAISQLAMAGLTVYLGLLIGYNYQLQRGFAESWAIQRAFWSDVLAVAPDLQDGSVILVEGEGLPRGRFIGANSWSDVWVLPHLLDFPSAWQAPPELRVMRGAWQSEAYIADGHVQLPLAWRGTSTTLRDGSVILLHYANGELERQTGQIELAGQRLELQNPPSQSASLELPRGALYPYLIETK